jgi:hypothetical protein
MIKRVRALVVGATILPLAACVPASAGTQSPRPDYDTHLKIVGHAVTHAPSGQVREVAFDDCASGQSKGFVGVDLISTDGPTLLRIVQDPIEGTRARFARIGTSTVLNAADCSVLDARIARSWWDRSSRGAHDLDGSVKLECRAGGATYSANATFTSCHGYSDLATSIVDETSASAR